MSSAEAQWLDLARKGDDDAFGNLVELYQRPVFSLCYRMMSDSGEAEDAAQETFWRAYQALKRYDPQRPFLTWLLSIGAHYCIDQLRKKRLASLPLDVLPEEAVPDSSADPEDHLSRVEEQRRLRQLLGNLGPQDRAAIILRYWYDLSEEEIGESLSLSVSAVKSRLHRSRRELASQWKEPQPQIIRNERRRHESLIL
ncbi:MAG: sigma-70 family RNA polymerase sigma factor [Chloroflexi bacterium]|nr:sigma-70 family RNA polymerase sigma factor [Chloroflexota bacterium]